MPVTACFFHEHAASSIVTVNIPSWWFLLHSPGNIAVIKQALLLKPYNLCCKPSAISLPRLHWTNRKFSVFHKSLYPRSSTTGLAESWAELHSALVKSSLTSFLQSVQRRKQLCSFGNPALVFLCTTSVIKWKSTTLACSFNRFDWLTATNLILAAKRYLAGITGV